MHNPVLQELLRHACQIPCYDVPTALQRVLDGYDERPLYKLPEATSKAIAELADKFKKNNDELVYLQFELMKFVDSLANDN